VASRTSWSNCAKLWRGIAPHVETSRSCEGSEAPGPFCPVVPGRASHLKLRCSRLVEGESNATTGRGQPRTAPNLTQVFPLVRELAETRGLTKAPVPTEGERQRDSDALLRNSKGSRPLGTSMRTLVLFVYPVPAIYAAGLLKSIEIFFPKCMI